MILHEYQEKFAKLKMNANRPNQKSPHKVAMLMAIMDLIEAGKIKDNQIFFNNELKKAFSKQFDKLKKSGDLNAPQLPFFHLKTSGFWHHEIKEGREDAYAKVKRGKNPKDIDDIQYAYLVSDLFDLLQNAYARSLLRVSLLRNFNSEELGFLQKINVEIDQRQPALDWKELIDDSIPVGSRIEEAQKQRYQQRKRQGRHTDWEAVDKNRRQLGFLGELHVYIIEQLKMWRDQPSLAGDVKWISYDEGDGPGYDIESFDPVTGDKLFIEVKTTSRGRLEPFYITDNELQCSREKADRYQISRVYDYWKSQRLYEVRGCDNLEKHFSKSGVLYRVSPKS